MDPEYLKENSLNVTARLSSDLYQIDQSPFSLFDLAGSNSVRVTEAHLQEIWKFIVHVIKPKEIYFKSLRRRGQIDKDGKAYPIHTNNAGFHFEALLENGQTMIITPEPGAIELNLAPQRISEIASAWSNIFKRAKKNGFVGTPGFATGGGGGHIHIGFDSIETNLFLLEPFTAFSLFHLGVALPGIPYMLRELEDFGINSSSFTPGDLIIPYNFDREPRRLQKFASRQLRTRILPSLIRLAGSLGRQEKFSERDLAVMWYLALENVSKVFFQHNSFVSLKNFRPDQFDKRLEWRFIRAFNSFGDLEAASQAIFNSVLYSIQLLEDLPFEVKLLEGQPSRESLAQLEWWTQKINLSKVNQKRLRYFGGVDVLQALELHHDKTDPFEKNLQIRLAPHTWEDIPKYEISFLASSLQDRDEKPAYVLLNGKKASLHESEGRYYFFANYYRPIATLDLVSVMSARREAFKNV